MNPTLVTQRANQFATKTSSFDSTVLLLRREEQTMRGYLITTGGRAEAVRAATDLAHTVGARVVEAEVPLDLDVDNVVGWLVYESGSSVARDPQVNTDPTETARLLANTLVDGAWVAVSLRKPTKRERTRNQKWLSHRLSTAVPNHHSLSPDAVIVSIFAGGSDAGSVRSYLEATRSAMPGFDVITRGRVATRASTLLPWLPVGFVSGGAGVGALFVSLPEMFDPSVPTIGVGLGVVAILGAGLRFAGALPSMWRRTQRMAAECRFESPKKRFGRPAPPRAAVTHGENQREARDGDYPLHSTSFQVGPQVIVGVVAPHAGAESGERETRSRKVPASLLRRVGPFVGHTDQGPAYLSAWDQEGQTAIAGRAGSGKTQLVRSLFGWCCLERMRPSGMRGGPGARNTLIAFESKGTGVPHYRAWAEALGDSLDVIDLADPKSLGIDIFDIPGTVFDKANFFVNALRYNFGDQAIGDQSFETLLGVLPAALLVTPEMAGLVDGLNPNGSPVYFVHVLLGGRGDELGKALAAELSAESVRPESDAVLADAVQFMSQLYGPGVSATARRNLQSAPRNKFRQLIELESWWAPRRSKASWRQVLDEHRSIVVNVGTSTDGTMVEDSVRNQMSAILMYSLRHAIQRTCSGWQDEGRSVSIFADELAAVAGSSADVIAWLKDMGREYGVRSFLATQRPGQLPDRVRDAFLNFSTLVSFTQENGTAAAEIAKEISTEDGEVSATDILQLKQYTAMVRTHVEKTRQDPFTVRVYNFEGNRPSFAIDQGYEPDRGATVVGSAAPAAVTPEPDAGLTDGPVMAEPTPQREVVESTPEDDSAPDLMNW